MSNFTPEQVQEILDLYFENFAHHQYIGARYVPIFGRKGETSIEWDNSAPYEPLTIVLYQGDSYTSRQFVPTGVEITNTDYWAETGNYNAQIEQYRQEIIDIQDQIGDGFSSENTVANAVDGINDKIGTGFTSENTVADAISATNGKIGGSFTSENTVADAISDVNGLIGNGFTSESTVTDAISTIQKRLTPYDFAGKKFAFIGDSITIGQSDTPTPYEHPWPWTLCNICGAAYYNFAVGGATFNSSLSPVENNFREQVTSIISADWGTQPPDYVFIMLGTNDVGMNAAIGALNENAYNDWTTVTGAMKAGITMLRDTFPNTTVIGVIPPFMMNDNTRGGNNLTAMDYKTYIKIMYDMMNVPTIDFTTSLSFDETNWLDHVWDSSSTKLHPNQATHDFMGKIAAGMLPSICNRMYSMVAAQNWGTLPMTEAATGSIYWWIDEQRNVHFYTGSVTLTGSGPVATVPDFIRPAFDFYDVAIDIGTGNSTWININPNTGAFALGGANITTAINVTIPFMIRKNVTGNLHELVLS